MKNLILNLPFIKAVTLVYVVVMLVVSYLLFKEYVDSDLPYFLQPDVHITYVLIVMAWVLLFLIYNGSNAPSALQVATTWISIIGIGVSCFHDFYALSIMIVFFVGSFLLGLWETVVSEKKETQPE